MNKVHKKIKIEEDAEKVLNYEFEYLKTSVGLARQSIEAGLRNLEIAEEDLEQFRKTLGALLGGREWRREEPSPRIKRFFGAKFFKMIKNK